MKIKIEGKQHLAGIAKKTGKPYDFNQIHYLGKARGVEGRAALTLALDPNDFPYDGLFVGMEYLVDFDQRGYPQSIEPADRAAWEKACANFDKAPH